MLKHQGINTKILNVYIVPEVCTLFHGIIGKALELPWGNLNAVIGNIWQLNFPNNLITETNPFFFSQILDRDLQPHSLPMQTFYRSYRWQKFHAGQWPCHPRSLFSGLTLRSTTLHRHPDHWLIFLSLSPRSHRHNLTCQIAAYCRQRHCPNWCDATFAVPHQFPKVVPTLLLATSGAASIDICAWTHTDVFHISPDSHYNLGSKSCEFNWSRTI